MTRYLRTPMGVGRKCAVIDLLKEVSNEMILIGKDNINA